MFIRAHLLFNLYVQSKKIDIFFMICFYEEIFYDLQMEDIVTKYRVLGALLACYKFNPADITAYSGVPVEHVERIASPYWRQTGRPDRTHELNPDKKEEVIKFLDESTATPEIRKYLTEKSPWNPEILERFISLFELHLDKAERAGAEKEGDLSECNVRRRLALVGLIDSEKVYGPDVAGLAHLKAEFNRQVERYEALLSAQGNRPSKTSQVRAPVWTQS